ncbi:MAG: hypothetical protein NZ941_04370, partial [Candidatus Caldarchaeum sp.]|nr:hypothetical protein [Candidatus Caldarchaeum sp.]
HSFLRAVIRRESERQKGYGLLDDGQKIANTLQPLFATPPRTIRTEHTFTGLGQKAQICLRGPFPPIHGNKATLPAGRKRSHPLFSGVAPSIASLSNLPASTTSFLIQVIKQAQLSLKHLLLTNPWLLRNGSQQVRRRDALLTVYRSLTFWRRKWPCIKLMGGARDL